MLTGQRMYVCVSELPKFLHVVLFECDPRFIKLLALSTARTQSEQLILKSVDCTDCSY